jgi:SAM-dependent methyltransferase
MTTAAAASSTIRPSAAGTQRDIREQTDLARALPFFGSVAAARKFVDVGIAPLLPVLPRRIAYVDFGGGQGVLARVVRDFIEARGYACHATVVDANPQYLAQAAAAGISTACANIEESDLRSIDLATMRLVMHYNARDQHAAILAAVTRSLAPDGILVTQIETGDPTICQLHTQIANLLSRESAPGYHWATLEEYCELLRGSGFCDVAVAADVQVVDADVELALADAWQRFNGTTFRSALRASEFGRAETMALERDAFVRKARQLVADFAGKSPPERGDASSSSALRSFRLHYPIVTCRRAGATSKHDGLEGPASIIEE